MRQRIAVLAPTLLTQLPTGTAISELGSALRESGFGDFVSVADFFTDYMKTCAGIALRSGKPVISSACPAVASLLRAAHPAALSFLAALSSPAETAVTSAAARFQDSDITFVSPCPAKAAIVERLPVPPGIGISCVRSVDFLSDLAPILHSLKAQPSRPADMAAIDSVRHVFGKLCLRVPVRTIRGLIENQEFFAALESGAIRGPLVADAQLCDGGCRGGAWCPPVKTF